jgi:hypothetical protein
MSVQLRESTITNELTSVCMSVQLRESTITNEYTYKKRATVVGVVKRSVDEDSLQATLTLATVT